MTRGRKPIADFNTDITHINEIATSASNLGAYTGGRLGRPNYKGKKFAAGSKQRSKTFPGIAKAMADQWGSLDVPGEPQQQQTTTDQQWEQLVMEV